MREHDTGLTGHTRITIRHVGRALLMPRGDEPDATTGQRIKYGDVGMSTESKDDLDAVSLELVDEDFGAGRRRAAGFLGLITRRRRPHPGSPSGRTTITDFPGNDGAVRSA